MYKQMQNTVLLQEQKNMLEIATEGLKGIKHYPATNINFKCGKCRNDTFSLTIFGFICCCCNRKYNWDLEDLEKIEI